MKYLIIIICIVCHWACKSQISNSELNNDSDKILKLIDSEVKWLEKYPYDVGPKLTVNLRRYVGLLSLENGKLILDKNIEERLFNLLVNFNEETKIEEHVELFMADVNPAQLVSDLRIGTLQHYLMGVIKKEEREEKNSNPKSKLSEDYQTLIEYHSTLGCNKDLILIAGFIGNEDFLSLLKSFQGNPKFDKTTLELALGRNKIEPCYSNQLALNMISLNGERNEGFYSDELQIEYLLKDTRLKYLGTLESFNESLKLLRSNLLIDVSHPVGNEEYYCKDDWLLSYIRNYDLMPLKDMYDEKFGNYLLLQSEVNFTNEDMEYAILWLKENLYDYAKNKIVWPLYF